MDYKMALAKLHGKHGRKPNRRKVGNHTYLEMQPGGEEIHLILYSTPIVKYHKGGKVSLHANGRQTHTTKMRMSFNSPFSVYSLRGAWRVVLNGRTMEYEEGISTETFFAADWDEAVKAVKKLDPKKFTMEYVLTLVRSGMLDE